MSIFWRFSKRYLFRYWLWYTFGFVALYITQSLSVGIVNQIQLGLDAAVAAGANSGTIVPYIQTILLFGVLVILVRTISRLLVFTPGRMIEYNVRNDYYANLLLLQRDFFQKHEAGDLISRVSSDIVNIRAAYGFAALQVGNVTITLFLVMRAMLEMDTQTTIYVAVPMVVAFTIIQLSIRFMFHYWRLANEQVGDLSSISLSSYRGIAAIQNYHAEPAIEQRFGVVNNAYLHTQEVLNRIRSFVIPLVQLVGNLSMFIVLYVIGGKVITGELSIGRVIAFQGYIAMVMPPLLSLGWMLNVFNRAIPSMERLDAILLAEPNLPEVKHDSIGGAFAHLKAEKMVFEHAEADPGDDQRFRLHKIDLAIKPGKVIGIVGPLGSGKTTLLESLLRLNLLTPGQLKINNRDAAHIEINHFREHFSFAPQKPLLFSTTLRRNLMMALPAQDWERPDTEARLLQALDMAGFDLDAKQFPEGLETQVGEKGVMLSGGQRQRIALARAMLKSCDVLVLDDVLSAVDHETEKRIIGNIRKHMSQKSLLIASHRLSAVQWADEIIVMRAGEIVQRGQHETLLQQQGFYRDIYLYQSQNPEEAA